MNKISDDEIMSYIEEKWNDIKSNSGIDPDRILGIYGIGKICHGFATDISDIKLFSCYIPTFEELCLNTYTYNYGESYNGVRMTDFRFLYHLLLEQDINIMEATFTEYKIVNEKYKNCFDKYVIMNKETLFHYNNEVRIKNAVDRAIESAKSYFYSFNKGNVDDLYEACRIRIACELLLSGTSVENCINLKKDYHINYLQQILNGEIEPKYDELEKDLLDLEEKSKDFTSNEETKKLMQELLFNLYTIGLTKKKDFIKILTDNEQQAFEIIKSNLDNGSGYVSISQLTENQKISRPVFKNVLQKMKDSKVANIVNKGVKGTYIEIIDSSIL